jgi:AhpC/TSA family
LTYLVAAASFAGVACSVNLLLTFLIIRRVNRHSTQLARRVPWLAPLSLPSGATVPAFTVPTVSGGTFSLTDLGETPGMIAFLSAGCSQCHDQIPELKAYASTIPGGAARVLAVVRSRDPAMAAEFAHELTGWASVTVEQPQGAMQKIFSVSGVPRFYIVAGDGKIKASGITVRNMAAVVPEGQRT